MKKPNRHRKRARPHNLRRQARDKRDAPAGPVQPLPGHIARLLAAQAQDAAICAPGVVTVANILHAPHCRRPFGGDCTCTPEVIAQTDDGRVHSIGAHGELLSTVRPS